MAGAAYDISASAASGISASNPFYNMSGISFGSSRQDGGDAVSKSGEVVATASRQQMGGNQAVPDSNAMLSYQPGGVAVTAAFNWLPVIISAAGVLVGIVAIFLLRKK
jgi:hypothetical protein